LKTEVVALKVLERRSANLAFGQAVQFIDGSQIHELLVSIRSLIGDRLEPTKKVA